MRVYVVLLRYS